jgi:uncharacterized protein
MSLNKIIIGFIVILLLFSGFIALQIGKKPAPQSKVTIDNQTFSVEIATSSAQQQRGLSGRNSLPKDQGMLFIFKTPNRYAFWMKGMKFPLDIIFIKDNKIVSISRNVPVPKDTKEANLPIYTPDTPADKALEINAGLATSYDFQKGDDVGIKLK